MTVSKEPPEGDSCLLFACSSHPTAPKSRSCLSDAALSSFRQRSLDSAYSIRNVPPHTGDDRLVGRENFLNVLQSLP